MLELITKIRSRKWLFLLLIAPLVFTPVKTQSNFTDGNLKAGYSTEWEYVGIALAGPLLLLQEIAVLEPDWEVDGYRKYELFIDWGRIAYWELWVLLTYFCIVPWCRTAWPRFKNWYMKQFNSKPSEENKQMESE